MSRTKCKHNEISDGPSFHFINFCENLFSNKRIQHENIPFIHYPYRLIVIHTTNEIVWEALKSQEILQR